MSDFFSENKNGLLERWFLVIDLESGGEPLPNINDFGLESILVNYSLFNEEETKGKLKNDINIRDIASLKENSIMFDSQGALPWKVSGLSNAPLEFPITKNEFEQAYSVVLWADPFGSAAFNLEGALRGVPIIKGIGKYKTTEIIDNTKKNLITIKIKIAQSIISYFIDLVEKYTTPNLPELQKIHDALIKGDASALGKLGVMGPSIRYNNNRIYATGINSAEVFLGEPGTDLYDLGFWVSEKKQADKFFFVDWGDSNISIYDFKAPIMKLYGEKFRIGNDARIYSNEGFSNLNWGIVGYQLELGPERMIKFANMDPTSAAEPQDDAATRDGQRAGEASGMPLDTGTSESAKFPKPLDRRKLFLFITKVISENDLYTYLGVLKHKEDLKNYQGHEEIEKMQNYLNMKILHL